MPTIAIEQTGGRFAHPLVHRIRSAGAEKSLPRAPAGQPKRAAGETGILRHRLCLVAVTSK
jgi:hypothetical protein